MPVKLFFCSSFLKNLSICTSTSFYENSLYSVFIHYCVIFYINIIMQYDLHSHKTIPSGLLISHPRVTVRHLLILININSRKTFFVIFCSSVLKILSTCTLISFHKNSLYSVFINYCIVSYKYHCRRKKILHKYLAFSVFKTYVFIKTYFNIIL